MACATRRQIPVRPTWHDFNTGTAGAMARVTTDAMSRTFFDELYQGPIRPEV